MTASEVLGSRGDTVVADLMSRTVLTVEVGESLWDAWQLLFVSGLRHLVVIDDNGFSMGVLSDRSILAHVPATSEHLSGRRVGDVLAMVPLVSVLPDDDPMTAARIMVGNAVESVPVVDRAGRLLGLVTEADIVRWVVR